MFFTVLATLGSGEHYLIDLVVAFPFCVMVQGLFAFSLKWNDRQRLLAIFGGLATVLAWLWALRFASHFFWMSPLIPWTLLVATIAASVWTHKRLDRAIEPVAGAQAAVAKTELHLSDGALGSPKLIPEG